MLVLVNHTVTKRDRIIEMVVTLLDFDIIFTLDCYTIYFLKRIKFCFK